MEMVRFTRGNKPYGDIDSVASACLLSLVIALGDTGKMLQALTTMLTQDQEMVTMPVSCCAYSVHVVQLLVYGKLVFSP